MDINKSRTNAETLGTTGAVIGVGAGLLANKKLKINPEKNITKFITKHQASSICKSVSKDIFSINTKENLINKGLDAIWNADKIKANSSKIDLENLAKSFNLKFDEKSTFDSILAELRTKTSDAAALYNKKFNSIRKTNFVILGATILGITGLLIGKHLDNKQKVE